MDARNVRGKGATCHRPKRNRASRHGVTRHGFQVTRLSTSQRRAHNRQSRHTPAKARNLKIGSTVPNAQGVTITRNSNTPSMIAPFTRAKRDGESTPEAVGVTEHRSGAIVEKWCEEQSCRRVRRKSRAVEN